MGSSSKSPGPKNATLFQTKNVSKVDKSNVFDKNLGTDCVCDSTVTVSVTMSLTEIASLSVTVAKKLRMCFRSEQTTVSDYWSCPAIGGFTLHQLNCESHVI